MWILAIARVASVLNTKLTASILLSASLETATCAALAVMSGYLMAIRGISRKMAERRHSKLSEEIRLTHERIRELEASIGSLGSEPITPPLQPLLDRLRMWTATTRIRITGLIGKLLDKTQRQFVGWIRKFQALRQRIGLPQLQPRSIWAMTTTSAAVLYTIGHGGLIVADLVSPKPSSGALPMHALAALTATALLIGISIIARAETAGALAQLATSSKRTPAAKWVIILSAVTALYSTVFILLLSTNSHISSLAPIAGLLATVSISGHAALLVVQIRKNSRRDIHLARQALRDLKERLDPMELELATLSDQSSKKR